MSRITSANPNPKFLETVLSYILIVSDLMEKLQIENLVIFNEGKSFLVFFFFWLSLNLHNMGTCP